MSRVCAYVDGFNLYFGMKDKGWRRYYWLNVKTLLESLIQPAPGSDLAQLLGPAPSLVSTKYFTSRVQKPPEKVKRQGAYIEALETLADFSLHFGLYQPSNVNCRSCNASWMVYREKMTDVKIATELLCDAHQDAFDVALLVSGDSDLVPPLEALKRLFPEKKLIVAFPPARRSARLEDVADTNFPIGRGSLAANQFPDKLKNKAQFEISRPIHWQ